MASEIDWVKGIEFVPDNGEVDILGARVAIFNIHLFKAFRENMLKIAGPVADYLIYKAAKEHAKEYVSYMIGKSKLAKFASKTGMGKEYIAREVVDILTQYGYGKVTLDEIGGEEISGTLENSAIGTQYENSEGPVCSHVAGLVAGGVTAIYGRNYECRETECIAKGDPVCRFVVKPKEVKNGRD